MPPLQERIESCKAFLERAKKRFSRADEVISRVLEQKAIHEAHKSPRDFLEAISIPEGRVVSALEDLQKQIDLVQERDGQSREEVQGKWTGNGPPLLDASLNRQDLEGWMSDRNCDLRNAMEFGDSVLISNGLPRHSTDRDIRGRRPSGRPFQIFQ